jgi:hypothetical protein
LIKDFSFHAWSGQNFPAPGESFALLERSSHRVLRCQLIQFLLVSFALPQFPRCTAVFPTGDSSRVSGQSKDFGLRFLHGCNLILSAELCCFELLATHYSISVEVLRLFPLMLTMFVFGIDFAHIVCERL